MAVDDMTTSGHYQRMLVNKYDQTFAAADGAQSRLAPNGARYWCFGDTIQGYPSSSGAGFDSAAVMVSNSILVQRGSDIGPATWTAGSPAIPDVSIASVTHRFWATDIIFPSMYPTKAYVLCQRTHTDVSGNFITDGAQIAEFVFIGDRLKFVTMWPTPSTLDALETTEIQWAQTWEELNGYIYIYGYRQDGAGVGYTTPHRTFVARVATRWLTNPNAWQLWNGTTGWVGGQTSSAVNNAKKRAGVILDGMVISVRYDKRTTRWLLAHKPWNGIGSQVDIYSAALPQGPLTLRQSYATSGGTTVGGHAYTTYNPTLHTTVALASGKYLLGISHNGSLTDVFNERLLYKPEFVEVTIP